MGINIVGLECIAISLPYVKFNRSMLTLGRQQFYMNPQHVTDILRKRGAPNYTKTYNYNDYCETFFKDIGFSCVDTMDNSAYEGASILHNLNLPIPPESKKYDYIFDGGTTEHVFNMPQTFENIINLLAIGGIFASAVPNNNFSGHGMYQFSPEFFLSIFQPKYGMKILELYIGENDTDKSSWINVNDLKRGNLGRNVSKFSGNNEVYIICIAQKISDERVSLIVDPPNQYSYEMIDWVK